MVASSELSSPAHSGQCTCYEFLQCSSHARDSLSQSFKLTETYPTLSSVLGTELPQTNKTPSLPLESPCSSERWAHRRHGYPINTWLMCRYKSTAHTLHAPPCSCGILTYSLKKLLEVTECSYGIIQSNGPKWGANPWPWSLEARFLILHETSH